MYVSYWTACPFELCSVHLVPFLNERSTQTGPTVCQRVLCACVFKLLVVFFYNLVVKCVLMIFFKRFSFGFILEKDSTVYRFCSLCDWAFLMWGCVLLCFFFCSSLWCWVWGAVLWELDFKKELKTKKERNKSEEDCAGRL